MSPPKSPDGSPMADLARLRSRQRRSSAAGEGAARPIDQTLAIEINTVEVPLTVNGERRQIYPSPEERLLDTLRHRLRLVAAQDACGDGSCGACTVLLDGEPALSCLVPTFQVRHRTVTTAEALDRALLSRLADPAAGRCGACAGGVTVAAAHLRRGRRGRQRDPSGEEGELRERLAGHLCRCDYDGLRAAVAAALDGERPPEGED